MSCLEYRRWLSAYLDEQLHPEQRQELDAHLAGCADCRGELASRRQTWSALHTMEALASPQLPPSPVPRRVPFLWLGLALAAATALVVLAVAMPKPVQQGPMQVIALTQEKSAATPPPIEPAAQGIAEREFAGEPAAVPPSVRIEADHPPAQNAAVSSGAEAKTVAAPTTAVSAGQRPTATVLQVRWQHLDPPAARHEVGAWVDARHGFSVATDERHLSIHLPASEVPAFLQQFASNAADLPSIDPASPLWITVSLELTTSP